MKSLPCPVRPRALALLLVAFFSSSAWARVEVSIDAETLNELLPAMTPKRVNVALTQGRGVTLEIHDLKVVGFERPAGAESEGVLRTSLRLRVPELGIDVPVEPRLSLHTGERGGNRYAYLKFAKVELALPLTGSVDVGPLLPTLPLLADTAWNIPSSAGNVRVRTILRDARMGAKSLGLTFDLEAIP